MKTIIEVTKEDIEKGVRVAAKHCAVAKACKRKLKYFSSVFDTIEFNDGFSINAPPHVKQFAIDFDNEQDVSPFSFTIDVPEKYIINHAQTS